MYDIYIHVLYSIYYYIYIICSMYDCYFIYDNIYVIDIPYM